MIVVDDYLALAAIAGQLPPALADQSIATTYGRVYRLLRAITSSQTSGQLTAQFELLSEGRRDALIEVIADPPPSVLVIIDPRTTLWQSTQIHNAFGGMSMLQTETLAAAVVHDAAIRIGTERNVSDAMRRAAEALGIDLAVLG